MISGQVSSSGWLLLCCLCQILLEGKPVETDLRFFQALHDDESKVTEACACTGGELGKLFSVEESN